MEQARQTLEGQVLERAAKDPEFREQLKQDPRGTVSRDFGVQVPPDITVEVLEETPAKVYLVLPTLPARRGQELTTQDLEAVAGGWSASTECQTCSPGQGGTCGGANTCALTCHPGTC